MSFDYLMDEKEATAVLAKCLSNGSLILFLGAGISAGASLPSWEELIKRMRQKVDLPVEGLGATADELQDAADEVERKYPKDPKGFADLVRGCLYRGVELGEGVLADRNLIAVGALISGSQRGSVKRIVTLNFDCLLEWYISLCGLVPKVVLKVPATEGCEDVRIYHPHGFLPHRTFKAEDSNFVVLGLKSIDERLSEPNDPWFTLLRHIVTSGTCLFVGLSPRSFKDRAIGPLLKYAAARNEIRCPELPTGFWIANLEGTDKSAGELKQLEDSFLASRIVPLFQKSKEGIPRLLLRICQQAAKKTFVSK